MDKKSDMMTQLMDGTKAAFIMLDDGDSVTGGINGDIMDVLRGVGIFLHSLADQSDVDIKILAAMVVTEILTAGDDIKESEMVKGTVTKRVKRFV
ncbi:MAG: hypothetical protein J6N51_13795 [Selenomonas sp.]|nr:hypothetical protein [Selenomonas sp.]